MGETKLVNFRLTDEDLAALDGIIRAGFAKDRTEALRVALSVAPAGLAAKVTSDIRALADRTRDLAGQLEALGYSDVQVNVDSGVAKTRFTRSPRSPRRPATPRGSRERAGP